MTVKSEIGDRQPVVGEEQTWTPGQPSERQKLLGLVHLPVLTLAHHSGRTCFVQEEKAEIICYNNYLAFLVVTCCCQGWLLPVSHLLQESSASYRLC